ncbi:RNA polymerase sigma factor, sigma-70 family [Chryseobacterium taeanense]|uniref:RNA polymerase sigma factor n=1 Tax=Chryseobacterium taeanense TaxID=311334 RepID=A0A1G8MXP7_9FLAO|nr:sigma-70 family RNA polymerase sigma factor [Chryseobacterium taeanense]SDI72597.1 RNA polymerase sigma factor, sigma-70 family [Chryseobacterium taeanense]
MSKIKPDWNKIYSAISPKLLGICRRYITDIYTAEDIVQDSFITAIQKNHQLNDEKALFAWLKKIVVNNALQHIRKHSKDAFVTTEPSEIPDTYTEMEHHLLEDKNVFIYDFTNEELLSSIDNLPPHHKSVFNLYFIENHSHAEISGLLGITVNTSKSHLLRAKKSVQNYLLNNFVSQNTPKNKIAQLLVIFGLGGLLWAQTFQSKFAEFKISPSKKLQVPSGIKPGNILISASNNTLKNKIVIGITFLVIIITSLFLFNYQNSLSVKTFSTTSSGQINNQEKITGATVTNSEEKASQEVNTHLPNQDAERKVASNENKKLPVNQQHYDEEKSIDTKKNRKKIMMKDSLNETPQKVIVVKKIIKRDTIFVER